MAASRGEETEGWTSNRNNKTSYSWGANSYGQLIQGNKEDQLEPRQVSLPPDIRYITGGGGHTLAIRDDGTLWACGSNNVGQLGQETRCEEYTLKKVNFFYNVKVADVAGGWDFTLACSDDGKLFVWGSNQHGQLGTSITKLSPIPVEVKMDEGEKVCSVAAGLRHSAVCTTYGHVYCSGFAKKGQCGVIQDGKVPPKVTNFQEVTLPDGCGKPIRVVCGCYHTAALTDTGRVLFWGCNKNGLSTHKHVQTKIVQIPYLISQDKFKGSKVVSLRSGWSHMVAITDRGKVYTWGFGEYGQLGRDFPPTYKYDYTPGLVPDMKGVKSLQCGSEHNLAITREGHLVAWGWNEHGICGRRDEVNMEQPTAVEALSNKTVSLIGCGAGCSFAMLESTADVT